MTLPSAQTIHDAASRWAVRTRERDFADWDAFTLWLEEAPGHAAAYDRACDDQLWADRLFDAPAPTFAVAPVARIAPAPPVTPAPPIRRRSLARFAAAAMLVGGVGAAGWLAFAPTGTPVRLVATGAGEHRTIAIDAGTRIALNGSTRIAIAGPRDVRLLSGQALFTVRHDAANPFTVTVGGTTLVDAGTVFDVAAGPADLRVEVASGAVRYRAGSDGVTLAPGDSLSRSGKGRVILGHVTPAGIGGWQSGYLAYADAPLDRIAADLARNIGRPVAVAPGLADRRFTGTLMLDGGNDAVIARAAPLLDVRFRAGADGWVMTPGNGDPR